jgi:acyl-CoA thioesterase-1
MIKNTFLALIILCVVTLSGHVKGATSILLLGDSLSASYGMKQNLGWVSLLNKMLTQQQTPYTIINASVSGETTSGGLSRLPGILAKQKFDYLLIELGGNDGLRGFPPNLMKNNLLQMIALAKTKNIQVVLMDVQIPPNYGPRYNTMFNDVFHQVAKQSEVPLLPFFMQSIAIKPELMQSDGIHPNQAAQPMIAEIIAKQLAVFFPKLS